MVKTAAIPSEVNVGVGSPTPPAAEKKLEFGVSTPGTMAKASSAASSFSSPLSVIAAFSASSYFGEGSMQSPYGDSSTSLGIATMGGCSAAALVIDSDDDDDYDDELSASKAPPSLVESSNPSSSDDEEEDSVHSADGCIGIERANYDASAANDDDVAGNLLSSPLDFYFKRKQLLKKKHANDENADDDDDAALWGLRFPSAVPLSSRRLTPHQEGNEEDDDTPNDAVARMLHPPTAQGHYLVNSPPLASPMHGLQYSLTDGGRPMNAVTQSYVQDSVARQGSVMGRTQSMVARRGTASSKSEPLFKVFCLLLAPKSKIFEVIQLLYPPATTTMEDLVNMIADNATEPALGSQQYTSLCRPMGNGMELTGMASGSSSGACARIVRGEILVAVPKGYSAPYCVQLAKPILKNSKVTKLLQHKDPLAAPKKSRSKKSSSSSSTSSRRRSSHHRKSSSSRNKVAAIKPPPLQQITTTTTLEHQHPAEIAVPPSPLAKQVVPTELFQTNMDTSFSSSLSEDQSLSLQSSPPPGKGNNSSVDLSALQATLDKKDVEGAMHAFSQLLQTMSSGDTANAELLQQVAAAAAAAKNVSS